MKIVGFETDTGLRLGVVEGDQVDRPAGRRCEYADRSRRVARADQRRSARRARPGRQARPPRRAAPLQGLRFAPAGRQAGQDRVPRPQLSRPCEGRAAARQRPAAPSIFMRSLTSLVAARQRDHPPARLRDARLRGRARRHHRQAGEAPDRGAAPIRASPASPASTTARCANSSAAPRNGTWARTSTAPAASARGWSRRTNCRPAGHGLKIETRLNGKVLQSDNTANMMFPVAETLADLTQGMTLEPGDVLVTGTPSGVGHARKPPRLDEARRCLRDRDRRRRHPAQPDRGRARVGGSAASVRPMLT